MQEEQQAAVGDPGQAGAEAAVVAALGMLVADDLFDLLPVDAEGGIGQAVVEDLARQAVLGQGVAVDEVGDVLALDQHVGLADGVGLGVEFLAMDHQARLGVEALEVLFRPGEHAAGPHRGVIQGADDARLGEGGVVTGEQQFDHQTNDLARGEVLPGGLVGEFGELADQFLEQGAHGGIADPLGVQVHGGEFPGHQVEQVVLVEAVEGGGEVEALEEVADVVGEAGDVGREVGADVGRVPQQGGEGEGRGVEEGEAGGPHQEALQGGGGQGLLGGVLLEDLGLGRLQDAVQPAQDGEGQDDPAVFGLLEIAAQQIGDGPDQGGGGGSHAVLLDFG